MIAETVLFFCHCDACNECSSGSVEVMAEANNW